MADETRDLLNIEQVSTRIIVRYFLNSIVYERFLGFKTASQMNA